MKNPAHISARPATLAEMDAISELFWNVPAMKQGLAFKPKADDIIISPYSKCGTTWLQQIVHGLRTRGSMDFEEISEVTPWIEIAYDVGWDLEAPQVAKPRIYKSHLNWHDVPKGGRYICSFRHPYDAMVSFYRFFEGWFFEPGTISLEDLLYWRWPRETAGSRGYWYHLSSWWEQHSNPNVLLLCFEDMKADLPGTIRKIAHFADITLDDELFDIVLRQSSHRFMLEHKDQFDSKDIVRVGGKRSGLPPPLDTSKVTPGANHHSSNQQLTAVHKEYLDEIWGEQITARFGLQDYTALREAVAKLYVSTG